MLCQHMPTSFQLKAQKLYAPRSSLLQNPLVPKLSLPFYEYTLCRRLIESLTMWIIALKALVCAIIDAMGNLFLPRWGGLRNMV